MRKKFCFFLVWASLVLSNCTSLNQRGMVELEAGNKYEACSYFAQAANSGESPGITYYNVGWCYESGYYLQAADEKLAIPHYTTAARWNGEEAKKALARLGVKIPEPDLYIAEEERKQRIEYFKMMQSFNSPPPSSYLDFDAALGNKSQAEILADGANSLSRSLFPGNSGGNSIIGTNPFGAKTTYDPKSGNRYSTEKDYLGNTVVKGSNDITGAQWETQIDSGGNMTGTDADGNRWTYDASTEVYRKFKYRGDMLLFS